MDSSNINGLLQSVQRLGLKGWTQLDAVRTSIEDAISKNDFDNFSKEVNRFIEIASSSSVKEELGNIAWYDTLEVYGNAILINQPTIKFPLLTENSKDIKAEKLPWEYVGRSWFFWLDLLAKNYGWTENQIEFLDIDTALGLYQERLIGEQFAREWEWGLSEIAYQYDSGSKSSKFVPLERPDWMKPMIPKTLPIVRMRRDMLPVGNIVDLSKDGKLGI